MIPLKLYGILLLILCSTMENLSGMTLIQSESRKNRRKIPPPLVPDDNHILPIIVQSIDKNQKCKYASYWSPQQVHHVKFLANQVDFENSTPVMVPTSHVPVHHFKTIEKIALLLSTLESADPHVQREQLEECFKTTQKSPRYLHKLLAAADYVSCPMLYEVCLSHLSERAKNYLDKNKIKSALKIVHPQHGTLTAYIGHTLLKTYRPLRNFLINVDKQAQPHEEINDYWYTWAGHDSIMFKTIKPEIKIKFWFDGNLYIIPAKNTTAVYRSYICPTSKKFFCLFQDHSLEAHDLTTSTFLGSCRMSDFLSNICYSHELGKLFLIDRHKIRQYSVEYNKPAEGNCEPGENNNESARIKEDLSRPLDQMKAFAYDGSTGMFYMAFEKKQGIYAYDPTKNVLEKYFFTNAKTNRRAFSSLCLSHNKKILYSLSMRKYRKGNQNRQQAELCFWNIRKRKLIKSIPLQQYSLYHLLISPDDSLLALEGHRKDKVILHDATTGQRITTLPRCFFPVSFSLDSKTLAAKTRNGFTEYTLRNASLEKKLLDYSAEHIALLAACAKPKTPRKPSWNKMEQDIKHGKNTKLLLSELPESVQQHLSSFISTP